VFGDDAVTARQPGSDIDVAPSRIRARQLLNHQNRDAQGPMSPVKGYDLIAQAFTGMLSVTGEPDGPAVRSPFSPADQGTGMNTAIDILGALLCRAGSGSGVRINRKTLVV
jgi:crotonobetainyl-CoA:carnitine CoA-transferase CaiB-like acyl-CoA transferase